MQERYLLASNDHAADFVRSLSSFAKWYVALSEEVDGRLCSRARTYFLWCND